MRKNLARSFVSWEPDAAGGYDLVSAPEPFVSFVIKTIGDYGLHIAEDCRIGRPDAHRCPFWASRM